MLREENSATKASGSDCILRPVKIGAPDRGEIDIGYDGAPNPSPL